MSTLPQITTPPQSLAEVLVNEAFETLEHQAVYGKNHGTTSGLTWGYYGGRWGGFAVTAGTFTLTDDATNYIVVEKANGTTTCSAASTNWDNLSDYSRVYKIVTADSVVDGDPEDHRAGPGGVHGQTDASVAGGNTNKGDVNVFTKNQSVATVVLTDATNIVVDASLSNNFRVTLGGNRTLDNPSNMTKGMVLNFEIIQDGTGSRTLAYGTAYKWPGGTAPVLSTTAGSVDLVSALVNEAGSALLCVCQKAFA